MTGRFDDDGLADGMARLDRLMRRTLVQWRLDGATGLPATKEGLADALYAGYLIDNETYESLHRLWHLQAKGETLPARERLPVQPLLDELVGLFRSLANGPTLGKRHDAIVPLWMDGMAIEEIAELRGVDEQRLLVLLHEVVRYYELDGLETLRVFLANRV